MRVAVLIFDMVDFIAKKFTRKKRTKHNDKMFRLPGTYSNPKQCFKKVEAKTENKGEIDNSTI